ncbi:MAG: hypothetical protein KKF48_03885 [Nanoarchaeota archaeon]|nr:hypothetical protein [Nanoarchaeota archaeon]MBU1028158.1 hypothetical protein [Nanoarchaeota archaeon]
MKKTLIITLFVFSIIFLTWFVLAVPNSLAMYCAEMGYNYNSNNDTCEFDNETSCPAAEFYDGTCGSEYVIEPDCAQEGESKGLITECCEGLIAVGNSEKNNEGKCITAPGGYGTCTDCGNGICEAWEGECSCPKDCTEVDEERYCEENEDCVEAVNKSDCCTYHCPTVLNKATIEANDDYVVPVPGNDYGINCTDVICESTCAAVVMVPKCVNNLCKFVNPQCFKDSDCPSGKECKKGICILEEENDNEDENKVCCKRTRLKGNKDSWYNSIEETDCISSGEFNAEIVNNNFCEKIKQAIQEKNRLKFEYRTGQECTDSCVCTGRTIKCRLENGEREMTIFAGSGNRIFQVKGINASTKIELYHYNNKTYGNFTKGTKEIILPDQVQEKIRQRIKQKTCECDKIELTEDAIYEVQAKKKARLFWIIPVREKARIQVNAENGEILKFRNPWWGFLANDIEEAQ